jgi:DNA-binding NtrC family response regulator
MWLRKILHISLGGGASPVPGRLESEGWKVASADGLPAARRLLGQGRFLACVLEIAPGTGASEALCADIEACVRASGAAEWVGLLPPGMAEVPALRELVLGYFFDHHTHPADLRYLVQTLGHAYGRSMLRAQSGGTAPDARQLGLVGASPAMASLRRHIRKVGATLAPVLIGGESGSGKELAARAVHQCSPCAAGPFVAVNCGAIAPTLIHAELFGYEKGAFTGAAAARRGLIESASGGTLFLDEIAELPLELQTNLLRFLEEKTINRVGAPRSIPVEVRVVAATHVDLEGAVARRQFREDLFYRLNVLSLRVPPLRERRSDVPVLAQHFFRLCTEGRKSRAQGFSRQAVAAMAAHAWPGNVRELFNRVQRAVVMSERRQIAPADLGLPVDGGADAAPLHGRRRGDALVRGGIDAASSGLDSARTVAERDAIQISLDRAGRNITHAARDLGISRMTLYRLMEKHGFTSGSEMH